MITRQNLIEQLKNDSISTLQFILYGMASLILFFLFTPYLFMEIIKTTLLPFGLPWVFGILFNSWLGTEIPFFICAFLLVYILVNIIGTLSCWQANQSGDNQQFWKRFICLSIPSRIYTFLIGAFWALLIYFIGLLIYHIAQSYGFIERILSPTMLAWATSHSSLLLLLIQHGTFLLITIWYYSILRNDIALVAQSKK